MSGTATNAPDNVSLAVAGKGTVFSIQSGAATGSPATIPYKAVAELKTLDFSGSKNDTEDVTNFDSAGRAKEFVVTLLDQGEIKIAGNYITTDAGQVLFRQAFLSGVKTSFEMVLPLQAGQTTTGETWVFLGAVTELDNTVAYDKVLQFSATVKISGLITVTAGA